MDHWIFPPPGSSPFSKYKTRIWLEIHVAALGSAPAASLSHPSFRSVCLFSQSRFVNPARMRLNVPGDDWRETAGVPIRAAGGALDGRRATSGGAGQGEREHRRPISYYVRGTAKEPQEQDGPHIDGEWLLVSLV
jgi:hypothetical protein